MHKSTYNGSLVAVGTIAFLLITIAAAPMEAEEEPTSDNELVLHEGELDYGAPFDTLNSAALRKFLMQLDAEERLSPRVGRSWPPEPRGWLRRPDGRLARQWRADKRQVRFRQCYFNPISCFRK
ncbi:allatostatin [Aricia agestis]|uniref:allatostatin n=1 Tax=Aricia agestis TaxID=91739 RepID=UPI001C208653|nr:allatostatin [Aricia agestis]